jgi:transcriptional regulator with XRE-family HTH domain
MIEFGASLRKAREARGLTTRQVAETTHILVQIVEDLENEDFSRIVAPIYGRGFVKLYCETVGLDSSVFVNQFMALYNGERTPSSAKEKVSDEVIAPPKSAADFMFGKKEGGIRSMGSETPSMQSPQEDYYGAEESPIDIAKVWRPAVLVAVGLGLIFLMYSGCRALYRATDKEKSKEAEEKRVENVEKPVTDTENRQRMKIPPLYID